MAETGYTIPLSNANITAALQRSLNPDTTPQSDSEELITSGGVKAALGNYMKKGTDYVTAGQKSGVSIGYKATAEGSDNESTGSTAHAEGVNNYATGAQSHAEGGSNIASGSSSHAEGSTTQATAQAAHAEGMQTTASNMAAHAEGRYSAASGQYAHAEAYSTTASGDYSHSEGNASRAGGASAHAEGDSTRANGAYSHAEGRMAYATGTASHAEGNATTASGLTSHAQGQGTHATHRSQMSFGEYNVDDPSAADASQRGTYVEIVGNGTSSNRSNARTLDWDGNEVLAGKLTIGEDPANDMDVVPKKMLDAVSITDTASGSIASFSDGADNIPMRSVKASIEPVQDLHGYENPWPAGGGKNKLDASLATTTTTNGVTFTVNKNSEGAVVSIVATGTATANADLIVLAGAVDKSPFYGMRMTGCPSGGGGSSYFIRLALRSSPYTVYADDTGSGVDIPNDAAGAIFIRIVSGYSLPTGGVIFHPMISADGATFAPYSNECPISGWTGAEIPVTGINVWDEEWEVGGISIVSGNPFSADNRIRSKNFCPIKGGQNYYYKGTNVTTYLLFYKADKSFISYLSVNSSRVIAAPEEAYYFKLSPEAAYGTTYNNDISINYPSTDTDYRAYAGQTYPVTWESQAGTVFGGTVDAVSGELTVTHKSILGTASNITRNTPNNWQIDHSKVSDALVPSNNVAIASDRFKPVTAPTSGGAFLNVYGSIRFTTANDYTDASTLIAAIGEPQFVYPLAQPVIYRLSAQQITSLLGSNNIWSNTGDTEVTYVADPKLYVDKRITELFAALSQ